VPLAVVQQGAGSERHGMSEGAKLAGAFAVVAAVVCFAGVVLYYDPHITAPSSTEGLLQDQPHFGEAVSVRPQAGPWDDHPLNLDVFGNRIPYDEFDRKLTMLTEDDDDEHPVHGKLHSYSNEALELNLAQIPTGGFSSTWKPYVETEKPFGPNRLTDPLVIKNHYIVEFKKGLSEDCKMRVFSFLAGKPENSQDKISSTWCAKELKLGRRLNLINAFAMVATRNRLMR
jgi:hypothetical protein